MPEREMPWDKEGVEFDADKAKTFIRSLIRENDTLKEDNSKLSDRLKDARDGKSNASKSERELRKENTLLKVQMRTGLSDNQLKRLVGETEEELLEDAQSFASETGIELRDLIAEVGTPDEGHGGGEGASEGEQQQKPFSGNYRTPTDQTRGLHNEVSNADIIAALDF